MTPPPSVDANIYDMTEAERAANGVTDLPGSLMEAVEAMQNDPLIRQALGEHVFDKFVTAKTVEWEQYRTRVHQWEIDQYLAQY